MPINELLQKRNPLGKIGLGIPQMGQNIRANQNPQPQPQQPKQNPSPQPNQQPAQPPKTSKPGCSGCRRKRS